MSDSRARAGNNKMSLEIQKVKKHSDYCEDMPKGHKSPLNGGPISQSWDDLSTKINNDADYNPLGKKNQNSCSVHSLSHIRLFATS